MKLLYVVSVNSDTVEGKGHEIPKALFEAEKDAIEAARKLDPYKSDSPNRTIGSKVFVGSGIVTVSLLPVFSSFDHWLNHSDEMVRERALAKLTTYEKAVLGLR